MSGYGRCCRKPPFASYSAVYEATECADKIFAWRNFTPARLRVKKWRGQNFADKSKIYRRSDHNRAKKREQS